MKQRSFMPLTVLALSFAFLMLRMALYDSSITGTSGLTGIDLVSFMVVFGFAFGLYVGAFQIGGRGNPKLQQYQLRWIAEVIVIAGMFTVVSGIIFMGSGIMNSVPENDLTAIIGSGLASTFIGAVYAALGLLSCYAISMYMLKSKSPHTDQATPQIIDATIPASGINTRSLMGLFIAGILVSLSLFMMSIMTTTNFLIIIRSYRVAILIGIFFIHMSLLYTPGTLMRVFALPVWRSAGRDSNIYESLQIIHDAVKLLGLYAILVTITAPVFILKNVGDITILAALLQPSLYLFWLIIILLYVFLIEGQLVQRHYTQTGEILTEGRQGRALPFGIGILVYGFSIGMAFMFVFIVMV